MAILGVTGFLPLHFFPLRYDDDDDLRFMPSHTDLLHTACVTVLGRACRVTTESNRSKRSKRVTIQGSTNRID